MYNNIIFNWPAQDLQAVANTQNMTDAGNLLLNGTYFIPMVNSINFVNQGFIRQVSLTSSNDLSAATFTVTGNQNGATVVNILAGPNNNTVVTTDYFDSIDYISVDRPVNGIQAGMGFQGFLPVINIATSNQPMAANLGLGPYGFQFISNGCVYQIYQTLLPFSALVATKQTYLNLLSSGTIITRGTTYQAINQVVQVDDAISCVLIRVAVDTGQDPFVSTLKTIYLQL
jgi:hypothetical protein